jgi:hypothetical protein
MITVEYSDGWSKLICAQSETVSRFSDSNQRRPRSAVALSFFSLHYFSLVLHELTRCFLILNNWLYPAISVFCDSRVG